jgi:hypothetical protein
MLRACEEIAPPKIVIPGRPARAGPGTYEHRRFRYLHGPCSWVPGSRTVSAPRNDDVREFLHKL